VTFRFANFVLNGDTRQLLGDGTEVHLSPKALSLLLMLLEERLRAVSKAELQAALWPSTFVGEANLTTLVREIRRALGDTGQGSKYIRTVHRFGYRFVATVTAADSTAPASGMRMSVSGGGRQFLLAEGVTVIGRAGDAGVRIESGGVSRHHARIVIDRGHAHVEDLGSKNGTFVDGKPVADARVLRDGDEIRVGPVALTFSVAPTTQATETMTQTAGGIPSSKSRDADS